MYGLDIAFSLIFNVDEDIIQIYNDKNFKNFCKNFIDIALEGDASIGQSKWHYLIFKIIVSGPESCFPLISFLNSHLVLGIYEVKLGKRPRSSQLI